MSVPEKFNKILERIFKHEGGYTNDPDDRGNWTTGVIGKGQNKGTKYGISAMAYPNEDIKNLTLEKAAEIYYRDYWKANKLDMLTDLNLAYQIFDAAIQHGPKMAIRLLQRAVGATDDGVMGINTLNAINRKGEVITSVLYVGERIKFYTGLPTFSKYGKGWMNRMADNIKYLTENLN